MLWREESFFKSRERWRNKRKAYRVQGAWVWIMVPKPVTLGQHVTPLNLGSLMWINVGNLEPLPPKAVPRIRDYHDYDKIHIFGVITTILVLNRTGQQSPKAKSHKYRKQPVSWTALRRECQPHCGRGSGGRAAGPGWALGRTGWRRGLWAKRWLKAEIRRKSVLQGNGRWGRGHSLGWPPGSWFRGVGGANHCGQPHRATCLSKIKASWLWDQVNLRWLWDTQVAIPLGH